MRIGWVAVCGLATAWASPVLAQEWSVEVSGEQRTRHESLSGRFREGDTGGDQVILLRTLLRAKAERGGWRVLLEGIDARAYLQDADSEANTNLVDPVDILQAQVEADLHTPLGAGSTGFVRAGRFTLNLGKRRLVARNGFRNTINAFTGLYGSAETVQGDRFQAFYTFPVDRRPTDADDLFADRVELDRESDAVRFAGAYAKTARLPGAMADIYVLRLDEADGAERATRDRRLTTLGARLYQVPKPGAVDFDFEGSLQIGASRLTAAEDAPELDHRAFALHGEVGGTLDHPWRPRAVAQIDYASGDQDPDDGRNGRFDPLFGAHGFEFSQTGLYGPVFRANLFSPGGRVFITPGERFEAYFMYRAYYLAARRDEWVGAGLQDPTGEAGRFISHVLEAHASWSLVEHLEIEAGASCLTRGGFREAVPQSPKPAGRCGATCKRP